MTDTILNCHSPDNYDTASNNIVDLLIIFQGSG
jgi:hypothetical protein